jgi:GNAT superfamily N-acetyltransferase
MDFSTKVYTTKTLLDFINSDEFNQLENYPITRHRALSHINNPRADADDKILYITSHNKKIVGYRLIMVDEIIINQQKEKIGWYSCVWVNPAYRGKGIAKQLVEQSLKDWNNKIIFQGPVKESQNLYYSTGVFNKASLSGVRGYCRFDSASIIKSKIPSLKPISFLFKIMDAVFNLFGDVVLKAKLASNKLNKGLIEVVAEVDEATNAFIIANNKNNLFKRDKTDLNWILKYPWIIQQDHMDEVSKNYYFSSVAKKFEYINVKFLNKNKEVEGFVIYQIRNEHLSIQFASYQDVQLEQVAAMTKELIKTHQINFFSTFDKSLTNYFHKNSGPFLFKKTILRDFYYSKKFEHYFNQNPTLTFEAGDGDMIFT